MILIDKDNNILFTNTLMGIGKSMQDTNALILHLNIKEYVLCQFPDCITQDECIDYICQC